MTAGWIITLALGLLYVLFLLWYGGRGKPLSPEETEYWMQALARRAEGPEGKVLLEQVRTLVSKDDGREFVMQNLARYRPRALYPEGSPWGGDPRAADRRYGRALLPHLLRFGCLPVFIAPRCGQFIEPEGTQAWHYVAMVRYRSRRDFLRFALAIETHDISMHKWAALEYTQVFPVRPMVSLITVRMMVASLLAVSGLALYGLVVLVSG